MKQFMVALLSTAVLLGGSAQAAKKVKHKPAKKPKVSLVCPVTGEKIESVAKAAGKSVVDGKTYYFCCAGCKPEFDKNPAKYIKKTSAVKASDSKASASVKKVSLTQPARKAEEKLLCPVTGDTIPSKAKAAGSSVYNGKTYYFCCADCKPAFDKEPEKYLSKLTEKETAKEKE
jgi:YHS domain-containing protein